MSPDRRGRRVAALSRQIERYLERLCVAITDRSVGSPGNREATAFFAETIRAFGFQVECPPFSCLDWSHGEVTLRVGEESFAAFAGPYSQPCDCRAPLVPASTRAELEGADLSGRILLLRGELAGEQIMPKNFPFYQPEGQRELIDLLEREKPAAIIAATGRNPELAGGLYPFPLFEDGDFDIPSAYMKDVDGERLRRRSGETVTLRFDSRRIPSTGSNVIARLDAPPSASRPWPSDADDEPSHSRRGEEGRIVRRRPLASGARIVVCAHIDAKKGTPGALDDAGGVVTLLALAELLAERPEAAGGQVEIVAFNGEDYYSAPGQQQYLAEKAESLEEVILAVNLDGVGYREGGTCYSFYECPERLSRPIRDTLRARRNFLEGEPWYQGDHMIFVLNGRPALALAPQRFENLWREVAHTPKDTVDLVDCGKLARIAWALREVICALSAQSAPA